MAYGEFVAEQTDREVLKTIRSFQQERRPLRVSASEIATLVGCTPRTVQNSIARLERKGHVRLSNQKGKPTLFILLDSEAPPAP